MHALPAAPAGAKRRQLLVGTAVASAAAASLVLGMCALWLRMRDQARAAGTGWMPEGVNIPGVAANVILISLLPPCIFAQWVVYAANRDDRRHTGVAALLVAVIGLAFLNAQAYIWAQVKMPAGGGTYQSMFFTLTGVMAAAVAVAVVWAAIIACKAFAGRTIDREVVASHALYWYALSAAFAVLWFVVYVTK